MEQKAHMLKASDNKHVKGNPQTGLLNVVGDPYKSMSKKVPMKGGGKPAGAGATY